VEQNLVAGEFGPGDRGDIANDPGIAGGDEDVCPRVEVVQVLETAAEVVHALMRVVPALIRIGVEQRDERAVLVVAEHPPGDAVDLWKVVAVHAARQSTV
jgi:hypothetical protein